MQSVASILIALTLDYKRLCHIYDVVSDKTTTIDQIEVVEGGAEAEHCRKEEVSQRPDGLR